MKLDPHFTPFTKINQNRVKTYIRLETVNLLEENIGGNLFDFGLGNDYFRYSTKSISNKIKNK